MADPTNTRGIQRAFVQAVNRRFRRLRGRIWKWVDYPEDLLGLKRDGRHTLTQADEERPFEFTTEPELITKFMQWLGEKARQDILEPVGFVAVRDGQHWTASFIREAYGTGWQNATGRLQQEGASVTAEPSVSAVFDLPVPERKLQKLYTRTFDNWADITKDMKPAIRDVLTQGLAEGINARKMAKRLSDEISDIEHRRAETLARSEVVNSHSTAALDRYEEAGTDIVRHGEWSTAGDNRVCPVCRSLDGQEFTIGEMREGTFEFDAEGEDVPDSLAGTYRLQPPAHPNGRCTILPVVT